MAAPTWASLPIKSVTPVEICGEDFALLFIDKLNAVRSFYNWANDLVYFNSIYIRDEWTTDIDPPLCVNDQTAWSEICKRAVDVYAVFSDWDAIEDGDAGQFGDYHRWTDSTGGSPKLVLAANALLTSEGLSAHVFPTAALDGLRITHYWPGPDADKLCPVIVNQLWAIFELVIIPGCCVIWKHEFNLYPNATPVRGNWESGFGNDDVCADALTEFDAAFGTVGTIGTYGGGQATVTHDSDDNYEFSATRKSHLCQFIDLPAYDYDLQLMGSISAGADVFDPFDASVAGATEDTMIDIGAASTFTGDGATEWTSATAISETGNPRTAAGVACGSPSETRGYYLVPFVKLRISV
jgi:hypothetical protein